MLKRKKPIRRNFKTFGVRADGTPIIDEEGRRYLESLVQRGLIQVTDSTPEEKAEIDRLMSQAEG